MSISPALGKIGGTTPRGLGAYAQMEGRGFNPAARCALSLGLQPLKHVTSSEAEEQAAEPAARRPVQEPAVSLAAAQQA